MSNDKATIQKRLDGLAEVLIESTNESQYAQLVYEASAELDRQAKQIAMLRDELFSLSENAHCARMILTNNNPRENCNWGMLDVSEAKAALTATEQDVEAWEKAKRNAVLEEAVIACDEYWFGGTSAGAIRALKGKQ